MSGEKIRVLGFACIGRCLVSDAWTTLPRIELDEPDFLHLRLPDNWLATFDASPVRWNAKPAIA